MDWNINLEEIPFETKFIGCFEDGYVGQAERRGNNKTEILIYITDHMPYWANYKKIVAWMYFPEKFQPLQKHP